jgi:hypothetical protein
MIDLSKFINYDEIESEVMTMFRKVVLFIFALALGLLIAVFGVFLSVFADGNLNERLVFISAVLMILFILSLIFAVIRPHHFLIYASILGIPGMFILLMKSQDFYHILYSILILIFCLIGAFSGRRINRFIAKKKPQTVD